MAASLDDPLSFDPQTGLIPAVVQDERSGAVLMLGYMTREAIAQTRASGRVTFFSRRRQRLWTKGETSGNWLELVEIRADCDGDALLVRAKPHGPTCHTGRPSCFGEPEHPNLGEVLSGLCEVIEGRKRTRPEGSYTAELFDAGRSRIAQKVVEEAAELALAAATSGADVAEEAADLIYHALVLLSASDVDPAGVATVLSERRR